MKLFYFFLILIVFLSFNLKSQNIEQDTTITIHNSLIIDNNYEYFKSIDKHNLYEKEQEKEQEKEFKRLKRIMIIIEVILIVYLFHPIL
jgi:hypothetical protein